MRKNYSNRITIGTTWVCLQNSEFKHISTTKWLCDLASAKLRQKDAKRYDRNLSGCDPAPKSWTKVSRTTLLLGAGPLLPAAVSSLSSHEPPTPHFLPSQSVDLLGS